MQPRRALASHPARLRCAASFCRKVRQPAAQRRVSASAISRFGGSSGGRQHRSIIRQDRQAARAPVAALHVARRREWSCSVSCWRRSTVLSRFKSWRQRSPRPGAHLTGAMRIPQHSADCSGKRRLITRRHERAVDPVVDQPRTPPTWVATIGFGIHELQNERTALVVRDSTATSIAARMFGTSVRAPVRCTRLRARVDLSPSPGARGLRHPLRSPPEDEESPSSRARRPVPARRAPSPGA